MPWYVFFLLATIISGRATDSSSDAVCLEGSSTCISATLGRDNILLQTERVALGASKLEQGSDALEAESEHGTLELLRESPSSWELGHFNNINAERSRGYTCPDGTYYPPNSNALQWDCRLWRAAQGWSKRMATEGFEGHRYGDSTSCKRTAAEGYPTNRGCGENLALGQSTSESAIAELKKSKEHCRNFFDPAYNMLGVGYFYSASSKYKHYWTDSFGSWHKGPDQSCIGGSPAPTPAPGCADIDTYNCQFYKQEGLCSTSNVQAQCKDTCGIGSCGSGPGPAPAPAPPSTGACEDTTGSCAYYKSLNYCATVENVKTHCKKTCGFCGGQSPAPPPPAPAPAPAPPSTGACEDTTGSCAYYKSLNYCATVENVKTHCKKTCGFCGGQSPAPPPPAPAPAPPSTGACEDTTGSCAYYKSLNYCSTVENVKTHCKKTCGLCR